MSRLPVPSPATFDDRPAARARLGLALRRATPLTVWLGALGVAVFMHDRLNSPLALTGYVEPRTAVVSSLDSRQVSVVIVELHAQVRQGQMLILLDDSLERVGLERVQAESLRLRAELGAARANALINEQRDEISSLRTQRDYLIDSLKTQVDFLAQCATTAADQMRLSGAQVDFEIMERLMGANQASPIEFNRIRTLVGELTERVEGGKRLIEQMQADHDIAVQRWRDYFSVPQERPPAGDLLLPIELAISVQQQEVARLNYQIQRLALKCPFDGQVTTLTVNAGQNYQPGQPLLTVTATANHRIEAYLPEARLPGPVEGTRVQLQRVSTREQFEGVIASRSSEIAELPLRFRPRFDLQQWGQRYVIETAAGRPLTANEAVRIRILR